MARVLGQGFKVGAVVAIIDEHGSRVSGITRIREIGKVHLTITDGTKFRLDGTSLRGSGWYSGPHLMIATKEHAQELKRRRMLSRLGGLKWSDLDDATLVKIVATLDAAEAAKKATT